MTDTQTPTASQPSDVNTRRINRWHMRAIWAWFTGVAVFILLNYVFDGDRDPGFRDASYVLLIVGVFATLIPVRMPRFVAVYKIVIGMSLAAIVCTVLSAVL